MGDGGLTADALRLAAATGRWDLVAADERPLDEHDRLALRCALADGGNADELAAGWRKVAAAVAARRK